MSGCKQNRSNEIIFVYGTLMHGHSNNFHLNGSRFLGDGEIKGLALYNVTPYYPGVIHEDGGIVLGEVYKVDSSTLKALDRLESNGYLYQREKFSVLVKGGATVEAWIYLWLEPVRGSRVSLEKQPWRKEKSKCS